jgi:3-hydroxybutyryl-CoA dehydrogenase
MSTDPEQVRQIRSVAMIGTGTMGWQISARAASAGYPVTLYDADPTAPARAIEHMRGELPAAIAAGQWSSTLDETVSRIQIADSLAAAVAGADLVIEAVREEINVKLALFAELDRLAHDAILATNSSSLLSAELVPAVSRPHRLLNLHFLQPIWIRPAVELMSCGQTAPDVMTAVERFGRSLDLVTAVVQRQSKGFIINRVWRAIKRESLRVVDEGHASVEDVDRLFMLFFGIEMGPFGLMDKVGLDVVSDIEDTYIAVATDPTDRGSPTLRRLVAAGQLGAKTGSGFYQYPDPAYLKPGWLRGDDQR